MAARMPNSRPQGSADFRKVADAFLSGEGLPFADVLSAERIARVFAKHGCLFGLHGVYTTALVVWPFLSQVLRDGKEASCQAAAARVVSYCEQAGLDAPTEDTGDDCRARAKLSEAALHALSNEIAAEMEQAADSTWLWKGKYHAKLIDGSTFTMPDTPENQAEYPHPKTQKRGIGLPIARFVAIVSLATACAMDLAVGPYKGKETGAGGAAADDARQLAPRRRRRDGPLLRFLLDDGLAPRSRNAGLRTQTSASQIGLRAPTVGWSVASGWASTIT